MLPCVSSDASTTMKAMLNSSPACGVPAISGNSASTIGTAPRRPTQEMNQVSRAVKRNGRRHSQTASRPRDEDQRQRDRQAGPQRLQHRRRRDQQAEQQEHAGLRQPGIAVHRRQRRRHRGGGAVGDDQAEQVDGQEAGAAEQAGGGEDRQPAGADQQRQHAAVGVARGHPLQSATPSRSRWRRRHSRPQPNCRRKPPASVGADGRGLPWRRCRSAR